MNSEIERLRKAVSETDDPTRLQALTVQIQALQPSLAARRLLGSALIRIGLSTGDIRLVKIGLERLESVDPASPYELSRALSHDLRNPIAAILMNAELLANGINLPKIELQEIGVGMGRLAQRMLNTVNSLNDYNALREGVSHYRPSSVFLQGPLHKAVLQARQVADARGALLEVPEVVERVQGDVHTLERVLAAVLIHAVSHTTAQGIARLAIAYGERSLCLLVTDDGPTPGPSQLELRLGGLPGRKDPGDALNLSLTVARLLVERMGGALKCVAGRDAGATFEITLLIAY